MKLGVLFTLKKRHNMPQKYSYSFGLGSFKILQLVVCQPLELQGCKVPHVKDFIFCKTYYLNKIHYSDFKAKVICGGSNYPYFNS